MVLTSRVERKEGVAISAEGAEAMLRAGAEFAMSSPGKFSLFFVFLWVVFGGLLTFLIVAEPATPYTVVADDDEDDDADGELEFGFDSDFPEDE